MKKILLVLCSLFSLQLQAQVHFTIGSGAHWVVSGPCKVRMDTGFFVNNGHYTDAAGSFIAAGGINFGGTGITSFSDFVVNNSQHSVINSLISVYDEASLISGWLQANNLLFIRSDVNPDARMFVSGVLLVDVMGITISATDTVGPCSGFTPQLSLNISGPSISYQWQSSADSSSWSNITGATNDTYEPLVTSAMYYRCYISANNSSFDQYTHGLHLLPDNDVDDITGPSAVCAGSSITLSSTTPGGSWNSQHTSIAQVGTANGIVTGVAEGITNITYTVGGCYRTATVSVHAVPAASPMPANTGYCTGSACPEITLTSSQTDVNYQLYLGASASGSPVAGTGGAITFGAQCTAGTYSVQAVNSATGCAAPMSGTTSIVIYTLPAAGFTINTVTQPLTTNNYLFTNTGATGSSYSYSWDLGDGSAPSSLESPAHVYTAAGTYTVTQTVTNTGTGCNSIAAHEVVVTSDGIGGGGGGGLESESLGGLVSKLDFNDIKNSIDRRIDYKVAQQFTKTPSAHLAARSTAPVSNLQRFMPDALTNTTAYINSPSQITGITKAVDVMGVDFVNNGKAKAVALGITTLGRVYTHTKSVCDRFRGATLVGTEEIAINGFNLIRFALRQSDETVEYCIAFDAGKSSSRNTFSLQTNWLINHYIGDDSVFNFQVWAADPTHAAKLATDILNNLAAVMPLQQTDTAFRQPPAYIAVGRRQKGNLDLTITNYTNATTGEVRFEERVNEFANIGELVIPVTLQKGKNNKISIPIQDGYEYPGYLYVGGQLVDLVYMADGNWSLDYDPTYTDVSQYQTINEPAREYKDDEYPVYRGVKVKATSGDYISAFKFISSGNMPVDLTAYRSLTFNATGGEGTVQVRLIKKSITKWAEQYSTTVKFKADRSSYAISLDDFESGKAGAAPFTANDVTAVVFTWNFGGKQQEFSLKAGELAFSKDEALSDKKLRSKMLVVMPNPSNGSFAVNFSSEQDRELTLTVADVAGRILYTQPVKAAFGANNTAVTLPASVPRPSVLVMSLGSKNVKYDAVKITVTE